MTEVQTIDRESNFHNSWENYANCDGIAAPEEFGLRAQADKVAAEVCKGCVVRLENCPAGPTDEQLLQLGVKTA